jgi:chemotaxis protein methyltransferase CheR
VVIYFDSPTQARLWARFSQMLPIGGFLVMGHSERLTGPANACFARVGNNVYRKIADLAATSDQAL